MYTVIDEENIPIPPVGVSGGRQAKYPFKEMEVGAIKRFVAGVDEVKRIQRAAAAFARRNNVKLITRRLTDGVRVWRAE